MYILVGYWEKCLHLGFCRYAMEYGDSSRLHKNTEALKWQLNHENEA